MKPKINFAESLQRFPAYKIIGDIGHRFACWNSFDPEKKSGILIFFVKEKATKVIKSWNVHSDVRRRFKDHPGYGQSCKDDYEYGIEKESFAIIYDDEPSPIYSYLSKKQLFERIELRIYNDSKS